MVTGGAGFIGSHLTESLLAAGHRVTVLDSFANSKRESVPKGAKLVEWDVSSAPEPGMLDGIETVFHLAADPDVKGSALRPRENFVINAAGTFNMLEACRKSGVKSFVFTSSSVVYGEAKVQPTPEDYPPSPISNYAAGKLAGEAYCMSYSHTYGIKSTVLRLANIFGERSTHGVMFDFYKKLKERPSRLEILGNGKQSKSYLHVSDCVSGMLVAFEMQKSQSVVFNIGSKEKHTVDEIAQTLSLELGCSPQLVHQGGARGWAGDVPEMLLSTSKLESLGWKTKIAFGEGVRRYAAWLKKHY